MESVYDFVGYLASVSKVVFNEFVGSGIVGANHRNQSVERGDLVLADGDADGFDRVAHRLTLMDLTACSTWSMWA